MLSGLYGQAGRVSTYRNAKVSSAFTVPTLMIDSYCHQQGIERIHFLKVDTEGHDLAVLRGAAMLLEEGRIDAIQFEFSEMNLLSRSPFIDHWELLHPRYALYRPCLDGLYRIERYDPLLLEVYHAVNFVALRRT